jgi:phosphoadenosine phosphosulfate reductase
MPHETTLFGEHTKVEIAIARIKAFEPMALMHNPRGYYVCVSGDKDSSVIQELCIMAGVRCEFAHSHTSVDHPETVYFVRREQQRMRSMGYDFIIELPRGRDGKQKTMWNKIPTYGLPLRNQRWCCKELKEFGGIGRYCITGVRWAESARRSKQRNVHEITGRTGADHIILNNDNDMRRKLSEVCLIKRKLVLNPIIDWSDQDVWDFIRDRNLPVNPLYGRGYTRVGCIGCPMSKNGRKDLEKTPEYREAYFKAAQRHIETRRVHGLPEKSVFATPEVYFAWWLKG